MRRALVSLPDGVWNIIDTDLKGQIGDGDSEVIRNLVISYLTEKGYLLKGKATSEQQQQQTDKALSYGHSNGWVETKTDIIKDLETGYISYQDYKEDSITISSNGAMANVRFIANVSATMKGTNTNFRLRVLEVWVKKSNRWVLFARQAVKA